MRKMIWQIWFAFGLITISALTFVANYLIFHNTEEELFLLVEELGFIPIEVLVVTLIIDQLLQKRERRARLVKLNMVIGAFYTDVGEDLLRTLIKLDKNVEEIRQKMQANNDWTPNEFLGAKASLSSYNPSISCSPSDFEQLERYLISKRNFILRLLENPYLLEHESFTDLLWAISHMMEELENRIDLKKLTKEDSGHLENDFKRAYLILISEWLDYMKHLQSRYPYLYSLSVRMNPFNQKAKAEISS